LSIYLAIIIAVIVAMGFQVGNTFQKVAADRLPKLTLPVKARAVIAFFLNPLWMAAFGLKIICWVGYLVAVAHAPISIIQPILGMGLATLALFSLFYLKEKLSAGEWIGIGVLVTGLVLLGLSADPSEVRGLEFVSYPIVIVSCSVTCGLIAVAWLIEKGRPGTLNLELILGAAGGVLIGVGALLTRVMLLELKVDHYVVFGILMAIVIFTNIAGIFACQAGFQRGRAMTVTALQVVINKFIAVLGGFFALGESLPEDPTSFTPGGGTRVFELTKQ
jgi:drug/metabolite transporter (DMT)-like permease